MAAPVIASQSALAFVTSTSPLVITKPTGLAVGDLLVALIGYTGNTAPSTPAGWTAAFGITSAVSDGVFSFYKIADSSDVAASDFSFTVDSTASTTGGRLLRVTGGTSTGVVDFDGSSLATDTSTPSVTVSLDTTVDECLIIALFENGRSPANCVFSTYIVSDTNPTWTELFDDEDTTSFGFAAASAEISVRRTITSIGATMDSSRAHTNIGILAIPPQKNANQSPAVLSVVASVQEPTITSSPVAQTPSVITITSSVQAPTVATPAPTWINPDKTSSTWTNPDKS